MARDNFTILTDASPSFGGHYYSIDGAYIGHIDDPSDKEANDSVNVLMPAPVEASLIIKPSSGNAANILTIKNIIKKGSFTIRRIELTSPKFSDDLLLDRCAWIFGEGMGCFPKHYAFAIQNGFLVNQRKEKLVYYYLMREKINGKVQPIPKDRYMATMTGAKIFNKTRNEPLSRTDEQRAVVAAVLESILEPINDPTHGCNQWRGDSTRRKNGHVIQGLCKGRWHIFYKFGNKTMQSEDITNSPSW